MKVFNAFALLFFGAQAFATTVLVVTDQPKAAKAQEVAALFRATEPFSRMKDLKVKVIQTTPAKLGCQTAAASAQDLRLTSEDSSAEDLSSEALANAEWRDRQMQPQGFIDNLPASCHQKESPISRLITCDTPQANRYLGSLAKSEKAKYALVVKTDARYGGSGGTYAVMTTGSPAAMAIHELMHQLGFADEYSYTNACEADIYCAGAASTTQAPAGFGWLPGSSFNIALFNARASYASNSAVRKIHGADIPWLSFIDLKTDLTSGGHLGSAPKSGQVALFRSIVCDKATQRAETWQSTTDTTIMKTLSTTHIPKDYWPTIAKALGTHITN